MFEDGRELSALLGNEEMARKLARLLNVNPDSIATKEDLEQRDKMLDLISLSAEKDLSVMAGKLSELDEKMSKLDVKSVSLPSDFNVDALVEMYKHPERFRGKDGKDGVDGKNGFSIPGSAGRDGRDGKDGERGEKGERGETGEKGQIGSIGKEGRQGKDGKNGADGSSIIDAYFNKEGDLVFQVNQGKPEINAGALPAHKHTLSDITDYQFSDLTVYEQVKTAIISKVGTGYTLPDIDKAVRRTKDEGLLDYDLVLERAVNILEWD